MKLTRLNITRRDVPGGSNGNVNEPKRRPYKVCQHCGNLMHVVSTRVEMRYYKCGWCGETGKQFRKE